MTRLADAYDKLAEAYATVAIELRASQDAPGAAPAAEPTPATTAPSFDDLPPEDWEVPGDTGPAFVDTPAGRSAAGGCPVHGVPWVVQPGGFSAKKQKTYKAFWKCPETVANGDFCPERPTLEWVKAHPAR